MSAVDRVIETGLVIFFWAVQIGITAGIALLLGWLLKRLEGKIRRRPGRLLPWTLCSFAVLCAVLAALTLNPPVVCSKEYKDDLTAEMHEAVQSVSRGIYSDRIPLVPACARIKEITKCEENGETEYEVYFEINYLYFGQRRLTWSSADGYDQVKPLFEPEYKERER